MRRPPILIALLLVSVRASSATLRASALFSDGLVLQTTDGDGPGAKISGTAAPNEHITLSSSPPHATATTTADAAGQWVLTVNASATGGPYMLLITGDHAGETLVAHDVLFGDVYLCSGQR